MKKVLLKFGVENLNGRIYEVKEFTRERVEKMNDSENAIYTIMDRLNGIFYSQPVGSNKRTLVKTNIPILGEIGHPENFETNIKNISHGIENFNIEDNCLVGEVKVLQTPMGEMLKGMIDNVVFRPRAIGTINEDKTVNIDSISAFDAIDKETDSYKGLIN